MTDSGVKRDHRGLLVAVSAIAILVVAITCVMNANAASAHEGVVSELASERAEAESALASAKAYEPAPAAEQKERVSAAQKAGDEVAHLQNMYFGSASGDADALKTASAALAELFVEDDASSARTPWPPEVDVKRNWRFVTTISSSTTTVPCVWLLEEEGGTGRVMAYALADYNVDTGKFSNLEKHVTSYGAQVSSATGPVDVDKPSVDAEPKGGDAS